MNQVNLQDQKLEIIAQIALIEDDNVIKQIKTILNDSVEIPEWHKKILDKRSDNYAENPESYKDIDELRKNIKL